MIRLEEALLGEQIYLIKSAAKVANTADKGNDPMRIGSADSKVVLAYLTPAEEERPAIREMLQNLASALPEKEDTLRIELEKDQLVQFKQEMLSKPRTLVVLLGIPLSKLSLDQGPQTEHVSVIEGVNWMKAPSVTDIYGNKKIKVAFWNELKKALQLT